ncbi:GDSL esterase/lipase [Rhynchospora pubera]|uniref:GDSL esterase/lipase n=2 Tax=Rhynchospora pubera TaxID=906938 RepID=A0AAV8CN79_9POAL|nr:GDSL esterase/lipase [Rhynchospora pubera]
MKTLVLLSFFLLSYLHPSYSQKYNAIYSFGDSVSDTGNLCVNGKPSSLTLAQPPYGMTFFGKVTCRCSDGRLVVDFLSEYFGLPLLPPSKASGSDFKKGANMAIIGATAQNSDFFNSIGVGSKIWNNGPLDTQIQWFQQLQSSICGSNCKAYFKNSLFVVGEIGGNDYNANLFGGRTPEQTSTYVPQIVQAVSNGIEKLIGMGAVDIVVPTVLPIGCFPLYLSLYQSSNAGDYDSLGCLKSFNNLASNHNSRLRSVVNNLQSKYPGTRIMYADFYSQVISMVQSPGSYGFVSSMQACCGAGGGKYNYDNTKRCGMAGASACSNPSKYLSWDGIHLTEAAYRQITNGWLKGPYASPPILHN